MLEDRIIVQDRGIDAGLAALMQNANKGSMDPAALLAILINKEKKPQLSVMRKWLNVSNYQINLKFIMSLLMKIQR